MIRAYHAILTAYGFWLPNDPRGSWSTAVWAPHLRPYGKATKVTTDRSLAHRRHDHAWRLQAKTRLKYAPVQLTGVQARAVGRGFGQILQRLQLVAYACSILPDHVHLVTGIHPHNGKTLIGFLKRAATRQLIAEGLHPLAGYRRANGELPSPWTAGGWTIYLDADEQLRQRIRYVEENPVRASFRLQRWSFVSPFRGRREACDAPAWRPGLTWRKSVSRVAARS